MELIAPVRVVAVDDRPDHLFAIANALAVSGIPCVWHLYDKDSNQLVPAPPQEGYPDIRLIVSDLNIRDVTGGESDAKNLAGILLSDVLLPLLPRMPCPYGLVLWSNVQVKAEEVGKHIIERIDHPSIASVDRRPAPLSVRLMDKKEFVSTLNATGAAADMSTLMMDAAKGVAKVRAQLEGALGDAQLRLVCAWETRVSKAATSTINMVYSAADLHAKATGNIAPTAAFQEVLAKLAFEAAGKENAKEDPARALDDGLVDLFIDDLRSTCDDESYSKLVKASLGGELGKRLSLSQPVRYQLNTSLHVETSGGGWGKHISRGLVLGSEDQNLIAARLGYDEAQKVLWEEFLFPVWQFKKAAEAAKGTANEAQLVDRHKRAQAEEADVAKESRLRLLEIGADCDHANKKDRTVRLLCALEIPERFSNFVKSPWNDKKYKSDSLMEWGPWNLGERHGVLFLVSVRRFAIEQKWPLPKDLKPQYRLRRPIVDMVLREYANHSSRLGYVAITG